ncbi:MAG: TIGR02757 family protein [Crocinitomicaceae bacterium]|nr:TIGR02757 family protein [Crocinitomicaceae bacterium]
MTQQELKEFLDYKADCYENPLFIESDPIQLPHSFSKKEDIEISGFLISTIAWGNRTMIIRNGKKLMEIMDNAPHQFILDFTPRDLAFVHRTFNAQDLDFYLRSLQSIYKTGSLEQAFSAHHEINGIKGRIIRFREQFLQTKHEIRSEKHLSNPLKNSVCKRLNMYLRWMVRSDKKGVDFGIWKSIHTSELYLPLDVHTSKNARKLGLLTRTQDDWKALEELMLTLRTFDKNDPVKYDFALFGLGAFEKF